MSYSGLFARFADQRITGFLPYLILVTFTLCILAGCEGSTTGPGNNDNGEIGDPDGVQVAMSNHTFTPGNLDIDPGTTVTWVNQGNDTHTVTSGTMGNPDELFDSGNIAIGEEFQYTFEDEGVYDYFCALHPGMNGIITVGDSGNDDDDDDNGDDDNNGGDDDDDDDNDDGNGYDY